MDNGEDKKSSLVAEFIVTRQYHSMTAKSWSSGDVEMVAEYPQNGTFLIPTMGGRIWSVAEVLRYGVQVYQAERKEDCSLEELTRMAFVQETYTPGKLMNLPQLSGSESGICHLKHIH